MTKKELIKRIEEYKPKYIYQRYDGRIHKYEVVNDNYLVETKTGMSIDFRSHLMLGKVSEDLKDLIKCGDYVNGQEVETVYGYDEYGNDKDGMGICEVEDDYAYYKYLEDINIITIVTKEQFESISYKVERKD